MIIVNFSSLQAFLWVYTYTHHFCLALADIIVIVYNCHRAEVWSLSWCPDDTKLATCSEDQTVRVWEAGSWVAVTTLKGHSLAVTSVDWKSISGQSLLVSCSDDRVS